ncbi:MAG: hypothetical protein RID07_11770, partial [Lacipirellulaceae bacterium]
MTRLAETIRTRRKARLALCINGVVQVCTPKRTDNDKILQKQGDASERDSLQLVRVGDEGLEPP